MYKHKHCCNCASLLLTRIRCAHVPLIPWLSASASYARNRGNLCPAWNRVAAAHSHEQVVTQMWLQSCFERELFAATGTAIGTAAGITTLRNIHHLEDPQEVRMYAMMHSLTYASATACSATAAVEALLSLGCLDACDCTLRDARHWPAATNLTLNSNSRGFLPAHAYANIILCRPGL